MTQNKSVQWHINHQKLIKFSKGASPYIVAQSALHFVVVECLMSELSLQQVRNYSNLLYWNSMDLADMYWNSMDLADTDQMPHDTVR